MPKAKVRPPKPQKRKARVRPPAHGPAAGHVRQSDQSAEEPVHAPAPADQSSSLDQLSAGQQQPSHIDVRFRIHVTPEMVVQQAQGITQQAETAGQPDTED